MEVVISKRALAVLGAMSCLLITNNPLQASPEKTPTTDPAPFSYEGSVAKKVLSNGLTLLSREEAGSSLVSVELKIRAGSALEDEYTGSGISHLVEHMVFKGTKSRPPGRIEEEAKSYGAFLNGATSYDETSFHITAQPAYLSKILGLLRDMAENASFPEEELKKEKDVIIGELRLSQDSPGKEISRLLFEAAYLAHPYKYPPIGYEDRFRGLKRQDLLTYYNRMYSPNRMVLAIVGDVDRDASLQMAEEVFGDFKRNDYRPIVTQQEPQQISKRILEKPFETNLAYISMGYHSTSILDEDLFKLDLLAIILGQGDSSRLNNALLKADRLVYSISAYNYTPQDPGLFIISASSGTETFERVEGAVCGQITRLKAEPVSDEELSRAKKIVLSGYISSRQTTREVAQDLAASELMTGSFDFSSRYVKGVESVTKDDIREAARKFLSDDNATVVKLYPKAEFRRKGSGSEKGKVPAEAVLKKERLPNGLRVIVREDRKIPMVSITAAMRGGLLAEDSGTNGISRLASRLLLKGTARRSEAQISGSLESLGGSIEPFSGSNSFGLNLRCMKGDLDFSLSLLKEILTESVFPEEEIEKEKALALAEIENEEDDIFEKGVNLFRKTLFKGHQYALRVTGEPKSIERLKREEIVDFYKKWCVAGNMVIVISGDVD